MRALVCGSLVVDHVYRVPRRPGPGDVALATGYARHCGGKGFNQAVALARLGAEVTMAGAVGDDGEGDRLLRALDEEGVDSRLVHRLAGVPTGSAVPMVTPDGEVAFVHHPGANALLTPAHLDRLPSVDVVLLQGEVAADASLAAAIGARDAGAVIQLNPAPVDQVTPDLLAVADLLCPNEVEARELVRRSGAGTPTDDIGLARSLARAGRAVVVTLGARGAVWALGDDAGTVAPPRIDAVDATGAGDSFCAALALARLEGADLPDAVAFACAAGAHAATVAGARPGLPRREDVDALRSAP